MNYKIDRMKKCIFLTIAGLLCMLTSCTDMIKSEIEGFYPAERSKVEYFQSICSWDFLDSGEMKIKDCTGPVYTGTWDIVDGLLVIESDFEPMTGQFEFNIKGGILTLSDERYKLVLDKSVGKFFKIL